ncbi:MAG: thiolase family protein [Syntrophales bacterium]|jgi:acetyl-CoA C-acetyltransferase|nr:thiolase family protein [Syntrophales bacterium]
MSEREVVFVEAMRTPFGRMGGTLRDINASEMAGIGIKGLIEKTKIHEKAHVDCVFLGSAAHCSHAMNPARWALLYAGLPYSTSASYVEMQCGSAIDSINHAAWKILCNQADIVIAGGMEAYSQIPAKFSMSSPPYQLIPPMPITPELSPVPEECIGMGLTAENLQVMYDIPREESDKFAMRSQVLAKKAMDAGYFDEEIIPVTVPQGKKKPPIIFKIDEHPRETSMELLSKLPAVFKKDGTVTAGNSSGRNDGSAFVLMMTKEKAKELGYEPMAKWIAGADYGVDPRIMGIAPGYAMPQAIQRAGLKLSDMEVMECNEAFAVQNLAVIKEIEKQTGEKVDMDKWNPNGGAIAFGHPNGASGARICMFTMRELIRRGGKYGIYGSCCGGGLGVATVIENLKK